MEKLVSAKYVAICCMFCFYHVIINLTMVVVFVLMILCQVCADIFMSILYLYLCSIDSYVNISGKVTYSLHARGCNLRNKRHYRICWCLRPFVTNHLCILLGVSHDTADWGDIYRSLKIESCHDANFSTLSPLVAADYLWCLSDDKDDYEMILGFQWYHHPWLPAKNAIKYLIKHHHYLHLVYFMYTYVKIYLNKPLNARKCGHMLYFPVVCHLFLSFHYQPYPGCGIGADDSVPIICWYFTGMLCFWVCAVLIAVSTYLGEVHVAYIHGM